MFIIELSPGCWFSPWCDGETTLVKFSAARYKTAAAAKSQLTKLRKRSGDAHNDAQVVEVAK